jgi:HAD superfamily hydrolase (TIGR01509 family)
MGLGYARVLVIFDSDGVLVDSEPLSNRELAAMLTELGLPTTVEESMETFMGRSWAACAALIEERLAGPLPDGFGDGYHRRVYAAVERELEPVPGVLEAIDAIEAAGAATCVASSGSHEKMSRTLGRIGLLERFTGRIFSAVDVTRGKPHPDLFLHAAAGMGADPAGCTVVEDSPIGIEAAQAAGMRALGYAGRTDAALLAKADAVFADMRELPGLIGFARR